MFYTFNQNNSGGSFNFNPERGISHYVIVEADNMEDAMRKAEYIGLYFNGVSEGQDCSCCGDRWSELWREEGCEVPKLYNDKDSDEIKPNSKFSEIKKISWLSKWIDGPEGFIHYKDGTFKPFWEGERGY